MKPDLQQGDSITRAAPYAETTHLTGALLRGMAWKWIVISVLDNTSNAQRIKVIHADE